MGGVGYADRGILEGTTNTLTRDETDGNLTLRVARNIEKERALSMCGIAGLVLSPPGPVKTEWMESFLKRLEHRGPDDAGWLSFQNGKVRLGRTLPENFDAEVIFTHRRLSILDLSDKGWQPMSTPDRRFWVVFNGEIYNYLELQKELEVLGHRFESRSDTEVLLAAFAEWGPVSLTRLLGMFAFAILDVRARKLFLVRDCFGIKPLYYAYWHGGLAFASEIAALLDLPGVERSVNARRLYEYLRSGNTDHGDETLFVPVKQLPAAHYMEFSLDDPKSAQTKRYWEIDFEQRSELPFEEAVEKLRSLFLENVRLHLRSDVPVGAALSGGIDSSSIVMSMRYLDPQVDLHTFSYVAQDPGISEERWIDLVGAAAEARLHKVTPDLVELPDGLNRLIGVQGEPVISTSIYAQYRVFQRAQEAGIKVMLDGQGADELLAGYPNYRLARLRSLLRQGCWGDALQLARSASMPDAWWSLLLRAVGQETPAGIQGFLRCFIGREASPRWLNSAWFKDHDVQWSYPNQAKGREALKQELHRMLTEASLPQLLHYEDRNSMAFSIESRVPFLTPALATFLFSLPEDHLISADGTTKAVFRKAMRGIVPDAVLDRRDKLGFPTPERHWLLSLSAWVEQVLSSDAALSIRALNFKEIRKEWSEIANGTRPYDTYVWRWMNLVLWVEKFAVSIE